MAEDSVADVRLRIKNIADSRCLEINDLDVHLITSPTLFLDNHEDQEKLDATIKRFCPKVVLLDPLVRLHRLDENNAKEISGLLGFIRGLQRKHNTAIIITHHATKRGSRRPGQALRGSSHKITLEKRILELLSENITTPAIARCHSAKTQSQ